MEVADQIAAEGIDLIEISGGIYESPAMVGHRVKESTRQWEAYFLENAEKVRQRIETPLVVTGGFRSGPAMLEALKSGPTDSVGLHSVGRGHEPEGGPSTSSVTSTEEGPSGLGHVTIYFTIGGQNEKICCGVGRNVLVGSWRVWKCSIGCGFS